MLARPSKQTAFGLRAHGATVILAIILAYLIGSPAVAENADVTLRRASERTSFTDDEIAQGFFKVAFGAELQFGQRVERIRKFDGPVRVFIRNSAKLSRRAEIETIVGDIRNRVQHLDLEMASERQTANFFVTLVSARDFRQTVRSMYGRERAALIQTALKPQCLSGISKDKYFRIKRAEVILPVDIGDFGFLDCAYEEMLQALGAINDDQSLPWTMFNDNVQMGFFDTYDQYILNLIYDPRIHPGMTKDEAHRALPDILSALRSRIAKTNSAADAPLARPAACN